MGHRRGRVAYLRVILAGVVLLGGLSSAAAQVDTLVQPRGVAIPGLLAGDPPTQARNPLTTGADANFYLNANPASLPFANAQPAGVVRTTEQTEYYVRFYAPNAPVNPSQAAGPWIMRASTVRGLTPEQIRDRFALPALPTNIENVLVPAGTCLMSGIAGPIPAWGNGGAQQTYLIAHNNTDSCRYPFLVSGINYVNQRPLGRNALWYAPVVGPGNAGNVGSYLDHLPAPPEYSDLYNVYNTLDVLNDGTAARLAPALTELTGENHASLLWLALGNADRLARTLSDHARAAFNGTQALAPQASAMLSYAAAPPAARDALKAPPARIDAWGGRWWAAGGGYFGRVDGSNERSGYRYGGGQGMLGYDWRAPGWLTGAAVALETSNLTVDGADNNNTIFTVHAAAYAATQVAGLTFDASALVSWDRYLTSRQLPTFARSATASYDGWSGALAADVSHAFSAGWLRIEPLAGLTYVGLSRPSFNESGAGALSLVAARQYEDKLASRLGATFSTPILVHGMVLRPWLRAFWAHDYLDTEGTLTAAFAGATAPGKFTVLSPALGRNTALVGAGAKLEVSSRSTLLLAYDGDWGSNSDTQSITLRARLRW